MVHWPTDLCLCVCEPARWARKTRNANDRSPVRDLADFQVIKLERAQSLGSSCHNRTLRHVRATNDFSGGSPVCVSLSSSSSTSGRWYPYSAAVLPARLSFSRQLRCKNVIKGVRARASAHIMKVDGDRRHGRSAASEWRPKATVQRVCSRALHMYARVAYTSARLRTLLYEGVFFSRRADVSRRALSMFNESLWSWSTKRRMNNTFFF